MKKKIFAIVILALTLVSVFAFSSCGKTAYCPESECEGVLIEEDGAMYCTEGATHVFDICINEDCKAFIRGDEYCTSCGTCQDECPVCKDPIDVEGTYCPECGKAVFRKGKMEFKFDIDALGDSALILCKGMLGIFIVTGVIISFILILNTVVEKARQSKENKK